MDGESYQQEIIHFPEDLKKLADTLDFLEEDKRLDALKSILGILILN